MSRPEKTCASCGRRFAWRSKWRDRWQEIRYCSRACRTARPGRLDRKLEAAIVALLAERPTPGTLCPSEAARRVAPDRWRRLMERTRRAARRLAARGRVEILQRGLPVDPSDFRGPIRLRLTSQQSPRRR